LPGVGKSAVADALGQQLHAPVISVDPIETAILRSGIPQSAETGIAAYRVGAAVAEHQLRLGLSVIADAANYLEVGRDIWRDAARAAGAQWRVIEIVFGDEGEHRQRLSTRRRGLAPYPEPTWDDVLRRRLDTEPWHEPRLVLDAAEPLGETVGQALVYLQSK
jgi:predicted kinase